MNKLFFLSTAVVFCLLSAVPVTVASCSDDDNDENVADNIKNDTVDALTSGFTFLTNSNSEALIAGVTASTKDMEIPAYVRIGGSVYKVISINNGILELVDGLEKLTIPSTIEKLPNMSSLTTLTSIEVATDNKNYSSDDGVLYNKDKSVLLYCPQAKSGNYTILSSAKTIKEDAFIYCESLDLTVPSSIDSFQTNMCFYCRSVNFEDGFSESGKIGSYPYVDLGLSVKWAICNLGATNVTDYGNFYHWDETTPYTDLSVVYNPNKYITDADTVLEASDDAAHVNWGSTWRMPVPEEFIELFDNCYYTRVHNINGSGINGMFFKSKLNGNTIFLPAAGSLTYSGSLSSQGYCCWYWTSRRGFSMDLVEGLAVCENYDGYRYCCGNISRADANSIRPVSE